MTWDSHKKSTANWERTQRHVWGELGAYDSNDYKKTEKGKGDDVIAVDSEIHTHHHAPPKSNLLPLLLTAGLAAATGGTGVALAPFAMEVAKTWLTSDNKADIITPVDGSSSSFIELE